MLNVRNAVNRVHANVRAVSFRLFLGTKNAFDGDLQLAVEGTLDDLRMLECHLQPMQKFEFPPTRTRFAKFVATDLGGGRHAGLQYFDIY